MTDTGTILYSFRRCPYAMRARMALAVNQTSYEHREVVLRDKPAAMIAASPKATVPVLVLADGTVIEESLEIMLWSLARHDPEDWLACGDAGRDLIALADGPFKTDLDRYKYANRYEGADPIAHRTSGSEFLEKLANQLGDNNQLFGDAVSLADIAIFPFVRQFANTDRDWFDQAAPPAVQAWLDRHLNASLFTGVMAKYPQWVAGTDA
jgi:glutathione S-transferase